MRNVKYGVWAVAIAALLSQVPLTGGAQAADVKADYDRATSLNQRLANKLFDIAEEPIWIDGSQKFWYRKSVKGGNQFVLVDAAAAAKAPAFDHARLATSLSAAAGGKYTAVTLPFNTFAFVDNMAAIEFAIGGAGGRGGRGGRGGAAAPGAPPPPRYRCTLTDYQCTRLPAPPATPGQAAGAPGQGRGGRGGGRGAGAPGQGAAQTPVRQSPDKSTEALIQNFNVWIRPVGGRADQATPLSFDGSEGNAYVFSSISWSPDSKKLLAVRRIPGYQRIMTFVQSSPTDQLQPKVVTRAYQKPGDARDQDQPVLFDLASKQQIVVDRSLFPNPFSISRFDWRDDNRALTFEYNQRGHQVYRVIEVDAATGRARTLIDETSQTFIYYNRQSEAISGSGRTYRWDSPDGREIIWMSQRDGWAHLYLYDAVAGAVKNQITKGNWQVHFVDRVDEKARQIYFRANGMDAGKDPYFLHHFRVNFDGTGLTRYTTADGTHLPLTWSADRQFYVDRHSRVDSPQVTELRRASDQSLVMELEKGDATELVATGWRMPEGFASKARDGVTDIWGIIVRPTNFDPGRKYPVIENIYAGPQGSFVPKTFSTQGGMQTLAELGFIVVQIDGMGTANRSKAFHDVAFKNLGDAGFPDRILWHRAVAAKYPYYDITRVGIYGTSAGGQSSMGGVLFHPEFYKAAASSAGCHDNRMDKIWWNEQWMGWPLGPHYEASSNMVNAGKLQGDLLLIVGEMDTNVDPASTMQVVDKLIRANKDFELLVIPGAGHTNGGAYGDHKRFDFFVRTLQGRVPPPWNATRINNAGTGGISVLDEDAMPWVEGERWER
jgi:dipeptidyl aminopeptidase/acylaminoacyl peptidase